MTPTEERLYTHLMRMVSTLVIIQLSHEQGHTAVALPTNLAVARGYLKAHCPSLLRFVDIVYRGEEIPYGLAAQAMRELTADN